MDIKRFITQIPKLYQNWGSVSMLPQSNLFQQLENESGESCNPNCLQLLNFAVDCLDAEEIYCQLGCLGKSSLIGALLNHDNCNAYGVDNCFIFDPSGELLEELTKKILKFNLEEQICFCDQHFSDFFLDLRDNKVEDKIGVLYYDTYPTYRGVSLTLSLAEPFLADSALIILNNAQNPEVQLALEDFIVAHPKYQVLLDWKITNHGLLGFRNLAILSRNIHQKSSFPEQAVLHSGKKLVLHVGCGSATRDSLPELFQTDEWEEIRLDINPQVRPDIIGSITDLSAVADESVDAIFSSHNLEHIYHHEVPIALAEFKRVIKPGGMAIITLPDIQKVAEYVAQGQLEETLYISPAGPIAAIDILYGLGTSIANGNIYMAHKTAFTHESLKKKMEEAGFKNVEVNQDSLNLWASGYS